MKFILWLIIIFLVVRMFRKSIFMSVYKSYDSQMKNQQRNQPPPKPQGTVTIENKNKKNDDGEYTEYEEVK